MGVAGSIPAGRTNSPSNVPRGWGPRWDRLRSLPPRIGAQVGQKFRLRCVWDFHVKLGIPSEGAGGAEHLWFDVQEATAKTVDATLINQPYIATSLREGQRGTFDLRLLTDWAIESPRGRYTPESVLQLERGLANDRVSARPLLH
ncbi:MAG: DUF2314 domain-containing protein [Deltaproteobacteria bacterium]|nr:MAG: DUF2314 domain-containing protein [Deltaproteobacteria bacterium]